MKDFRTLRVWEKAHDLVMSVYRATRAFPQEERFGLTSQLRRAAVSVPANIAEGCGRWGDRDFSRFLVIAIGSASEVEYLILLAADLNLLTSSQHETLNARVVEVKKMLSAFVGRLKAEC